MTRLSISFEDREAEALAILAYQELRDPRDQAHLIVKRELERCGLLRADSTDGENNDQMAEVQNEQ